MDEQIQPDNEKNKPRNWRRRGAIITAIGANAAALFAGTATAKPNAAPPASPNSSSHLIDGKTPAQIAAMDDAANEKVYAEWFKVLHDVKEVISTGKPCMFDGVIEVEAKPGLSKAEQNSIVSVTDNKNPEARMSSGYTGPVVLTKPLLTVINGTPYAIARTRGLYNNQWGNIDGTNFTASKANPALMLYELVDLSEVNMTFYTYAGKPPMLRNVAQSNGHIIPTGKGQSADSIQNMGIYNFTVDSINPDPITSIPTATGTITTINESMFLNNMILEKWPQGAVSLSFPTKDYQPPVIKHS